MEVGRLIMTVLFMLMYLLALVCFLVGAFGGRLVPHVNLIALGLAFLTVPWLVQSIMAV